MLKQVDTLIGFAVVMSVVSMLIMVATQAISSVLALRGKNLRDGLQALFLRLVPTLEPSKARDLAESILKRPAISDSSLSIEGWMPESWKLATAIRPEECLAALRRIAEKDIDIVGRALSSDARESLPDAQAAAKQVVDALQSPEAKKAAKEAKEAIKNIAPDAKVEVEQKIDALITQAAGTVYGQAQAWTTQFNSVQDRVDQWFTMHARQITVIMAFVVAFALQLNAFDLFSRLANDADLRNQLVNLSPNVQKRVDDALNVKFPGTVYLAALQQLKKDGKITADPNTADATTNATARKWLTDHSADPQVLADYDTAVQEKSSERTEAAKDEFNEMVGLYNQTSLRLIPQRYPLTFDGSFPFVHHVRKFLGFTGWLPGIQFFGMLGAAMLLTLGAPFWFNLLKGLASLRSAVSENIDKENEKEARNITAARTV